QEQLETTENTHQKEQTQAKINEIIQQLQEIKQNPLTSAVDIDALETKEPATNELQKLTALIEPLPLNEETANLLANLHLTPEQTFAISLQADRMKYHQAELQANYDKLTNLQKLKLLNAGLNSLGLKSSESQQTLAQIRQQIHQEAQNFDLAFQEKENILRLLITNLNLTAEQRNALEDIGVSFFDASNWQVSEQQKESLLSFGLEKVILTSEQKQELANLSPERLKTFPFTEPQKTILQSLAPLTKEFKYSPQSLELIRSLGLKATNLSFLVQEEILPDPNTQFEALNSSNEEELRKQFTEYQKTKQTTPKEAAKSPSRYDNLFSNLDQETAEHQRKKQAREAARKKLEQTKLARRQQQLHEKDKKIQEEEENRQRERELDAQEAEKRRQLQAARDKELFEQEQTRLQARTEQIERNQKLAQQALETKQKEMELEEQKQRQQIQALEAQNKLEQEKLAKQAQLLTEETRKRLEAVALEDQEQRQRIELETAQRKAYLEQEMLQERRRHERELAVKEQELQRKKAEQQAEITRMQQEAALMQRQEQELRQQAEQMRVMARRQEQIDQQRRANRISLEYIHEQAMDYVLGYYPLEDEFREAIQVANE
ncbi:8544_t:CDS:2, partial [Entrophospora sp. SA101]